MYRTILIFLFIGLLNRESIGRQVTKDNVDELFDFDNLSTLSSEALTDGLNTIFDQLQDLHYYDMYNMRSNHKARVHVRSISTIIWSAIISFIKRIGLFGLYSKQSIFPIQSMIKSEIQTPNFESDIIHEYLSLVYLIPFYKELNSKVKEHFHMNNYQGKGYVRSKYNISNFITNNPISGLLIFDIFEKFERFSLAFSTCWMANNQFYDLKNAFETLMKHSPNTIKRIVSSRLRKPILQHSATKSISYSELEAFVCQLLTYAKKDFNSCLKEIKTLENCIKNTLNHFLQSNNQYSSQMHLNRLKRSIDGLPTNCEIKLIDQKFTLQCKNVGNKISQLNLKTILFPNNSFIKLQAPENVVNYLTEIVSENSLVTNLLKEINILYEIYKQSVMMKNKLSEISKNNNNTNESLRRVSEALRKFEETIKEIILSAMNQLHRMTIQVQKSLVNAATNALGIDLSENVRTSNYLFRTMQRILSAMKNPKFSIKSKLIGDAQSNALINKTDIQKPIKYLITSMKRSNEIEVVTKSSAIVTLANTFLLATVFYECISMLALVMYGGNKKGSMSPESTNNDQDNYDGFTEANQLGNYDSYGELDYVYGKKNGRALQRRF